MDSRQDKEYIAKLKKETAQMKEKIEHITKFQENYSMMEEIIWGDDDFEKQFEVHFEEYFKSRYEWLFIRKAYSDFATPYNHKLPQPDQRLEKDKKKFLVPYINARDKIQELYAIRDKDSTEILSKIDLQIELLKYPIAGAFGRKAFKMEAESILQKIPMKDYKIKKIIEEFSVFRKSFL